MTRAVVEAGICGFTVVVEAMKVSNRKVKVSLTSECDMVREVNSQLGEVEWQDALETSVNSQIYKSAFKCIKHPACPVPTAIVKAIEVEVGVALPGDVSIRFETPNHG